RLSARLSATVARPVARHVQIFLQCHIRIARTLETRAGEAGNPRETGDSISASRSCNKQAERVTIAWNQSRRGVAILPALNTNLSDCVALPIELIAAPGSQSSPCCRRNSQTRS